MVGRDAVQEKAVGAGVVEHPVAHRREQPGPARANATRRGERAYDFEEPGVSRSCRDPGAAQLGPGMCVRVVQPGDDGAAAQVYRSGARAGQPAHRV